MLVVARNRFVGQEEPAAERELLHHYQQQQHSKQSQTHHHQQHHHEQENSYRRLRYQKCLNKVEQRQQDSSSTCFEVVEEAAASSHEAFPGSLLCGPRTNSNECCWARRRRGCGVMRECYFLWTAIVLIFTIFCPPCTGNPDAKRLYDDLLSNYNRLIRPVSNNTDTVLVRLGLRLSQLIDLVRIHVSFYYFHHRHN